MQRTDLGQRVVVVGCSGAGKTTLARTLAGRLDVPHIELDALHWDAGWQMAPLDVFRARVSAATAPDGWVVDGSYTKVRNIVWCRAQSLVWLDYSLPLILYRLTRRTLWRAVTREELWNGNREQVAYQFTRDSLFLWAIQSHRRHRVDYPAALAQPEFAHLQTIRLTSPGVTQDWLRRLSPGPRTL